MRKILVVAMREYQAAVRTKAFVVMLVAMPVLMSGGVVMMKLLEDQVDTKDKVVAVLDHSGVLFDKLKAAADLRNGEDIFTEGEQVGPRYLFERAALATDDPSQEQLAAECDKISSGDLFALVVIGADVEKVTEKKVGEPASSVFRTADSISVYSDANTFDPFIRWLKGRVNSAIHERRFVAANLAKSEIDRATAYVPVDPLKPLSVDADTGEVVGGTRKSEGADIIVPMVTMFLMFMVITIGAAPLINSVLEEKMQRIAEVLLGSVSPFQLMAGKLVGMVGVSLTILTVYLGGAVFGARSAGMAEHIPGNLALLVFWFVVFQALAVLMYGSMFTAIGAACSDMKEAQSMLMPVWIIICIPMMIWFVIIRDPNSTLSLTLSFVPVTTPMVMMLRTAALPSIPLWQPIVGSVLVLLTTVFCIFVAGRIFRVGLLMQGKGAKLSDMARWALRG
ncbi:MAG: ABC transporter permease [bacterium]|nr:ABC transporter permease [bacterium]